MTIKIDTLVTELIEASEVSPDITIECFKSYTFDFKSIEKYGSWLPKDYTRNLIHRTNKFELILLCWDGNANTLPHDHNGHFCAMHIIAGKLTERIIPGKGNCRVPGKNHTYNEGDFSLIDHSDRIHSICNLSEERAVSLHLYMPPIDVCSIYQDNGQKLKTKKLSYTTKRNYKNYE